MTEQRREGVDGFKVSQFEWKLLFSGTWHYSFVYRVCFGEKYAAFIFRVE
jgi:hypothetical protein